MYIYIHINIDHVPTFVHVPVSAGWGLGYTGVLRSKKNETPT